MIAAPPAPGYWVGLTFPRSRELCTVIAGLRWLHDGLYGGAGEWEYLLAVPRTDGSLSSRGWVRESEISARLGQPAPASSAARIAGSVGTCDHGDQS